MGREWVSALEDGLLYSAFVWSHALSVFIVGTCIGILPLAMLMKSSMQSLVSDSGERVPLAPHEWGADEIKKVNLEVYAPLWILKYFWCTVAEFFPFLVALSGGHGDVRQRACQVPLPLAMSGTILMSMASSVPIILESTGQLADASYQDWYKYVRHVPNVLINSTSIMWCCPPGERLRAAVPAVLLSLICPGLHVLMDPCVDFYVRHDHWFIRMAVCGFLVNVVRPILIQITMLLMDTIPSLSSCNSKASVTAYVSIACSATVHVLQVSADGFITTFIVYLYMMVGEVYRSIVLLSGATEMQHMYKRFERMCYLLGIRSTISSDVTEFRSCDSDVLAIVPEVSATHDKGYEVEAEHKDEEVSEDGAAVPTKATSDVVPKGSVIDTLVSKQAMNELVMTCNIMEGALIGWIPLLIFAANMNPYDFAGKPLPAGTLFANAALGLLVEIITDFACYAVASHRGLLIVPRSDLQASFALNGDTKRWTSLGGIFVIVLSMALESVGHLWEGLCLTPDEVLTVCP